MDNIPLKKIETYLVPNLEERVRLSDFAPGIFQTITSKKGTKNAIKKGLVWVNNQKGNTGDFIIGGETIDLYENNTERQKPTINLKIDICYEDDFLAVVNKPAGIIVSGNKRLTLENALPPVLEKSTQKDALSRPEPIHRLDFPTSGALLIGKTKQSISILNKLFEERNIEKVYLALTIGIQNKNGIIKDDIDKKPSESTFSVLNSVSSDRFEFINLVELRPHTGRRHQLRKHMLSIGNPILGDAEYAIEEKILKGKGLYLHSYSLKFTHPFTNESIFIKALPPAKFFKLFPNI